MSVSRRCAAGFAAVWLAACGTLRAAGTIEVCVYAAPDVPTSVGSTTLLPNQIFRYDEDPPTYTTVLTVPGNPHLAGVFKLDAAGGWLFSIEAASNLGASLAVVAEPRDVVSRNGSGQYSRFFCGKDVSGAVPASSHIDALYLEGGDGGDLVVSFDAPTHIGASVFEPSDLVRYTPTGGGTCSSWQFAASNPVFDASAAGTGVPLASNAIGASRYAGLQVLSPDVPTTFSPPGFSAVPGQLVAWDGVVFSVFASLAGWPISSNLNGVSGPGNPGRVGDGLRVDKAAAPGHVVVSWTPGCSENAGDYAVYEGAIGSWYSHVPRSCTDAGHDLREEFAPAGGNWYFLVVPHNPQGEGSYGTASGGAEVPASSRACRTPQTVTPCPD